MNDLLHAIVRCTKNFIDNLQNQVYIKNTPHSSELEMLKNSKSGKRCFIVGNGPSLTVECLEALKEEDCFACNRIFSLYLKTEWRATYYCLQDVKVLAAIIDDLKLPIQESKIAFFPYQVKKTLANIVSEHDNVKWFYHAYVSTRVPKGATKEGVMPFSADVSRKIYDGLSITYAMIQIAVYMGYKEIYLVGVDHNYVMKNGIVDAEGSYFDGVKAIEMKNQYPPELEWCEVSFREARRFCEENDVRIMNATNGGKLEVFQRIEFNKLFKGR